MHTAKITAQAASTSNPVTKKLRNLKKNFNFLIFLIIRYIYLHWDKAKAGAYTTIAMYKVCNTR